jgi:uncharacterized SAM-binding protein YcdF (DUF218 family)
MLQPGNAGVGMFPYFTRLFWLVVQPLSLILILLVLGLLLSWFKRRRLGGTLLVLATLLLVASSYTTLGYMLITPLEQRFERPTEPARIDGIVVLGGGMDGEVNTVRGGWELNRSGDRYVEAVRLALRHPEARVMIAAGPGALATEQDPEAYAAQRMFSGFGIDPGRIVIDDKSRNTEENAQFAKELAGQAPGQVWLLVTSAFHMPRSVGLFRAADFPAVPWPADYLASGAEGFRIKPDQPTENVAVFNLALREWTGLLGYKLTGKIADLVPSP